MLAINGFMGPPFWVNDSVKILFFQKISLSYDYWGIYNHNHDGYLIWNSIQKSFFDMF